jgi:hypothetical protein
MTPATVPTKDAEGLNEARLRSTTMDRDTSAHARATVIPIEHQLAVHEIQPSEDTGLAPLTLMELIEAVGEVSDTEEEVVATVTYMLRSGRVQIVDDGDTALCG